MTDETSAPGAGEDSPVVAPANLEGDSFTPEEAFAAYEQRNQPAESAEDRKGDDATPEPKLADEANADPEKAPSEEPEANEPEENLQPIEPPRSWTKEEKEEFQTYPRAAQEKIAAREQARETALRRTQNEAAETRKAAEALQAQAEQARKAYEAKLPEVEQVIQDLLSTE